MERPATGDTSVVLSDFDLTPILGPDNSVLTDPNIRVEVEDDGRTGTRSKTRTKE